jgi:hypothetical protein
MIPMRIYIAGPYSKGDVVVNVINALAVANVLRDIGFAPFVPHLIYFWHLLHPRPYEDWLDLDNQFIPCCHAVLRLPGESGGADKEVILAESLGLPVFTSMAALLDYRDGAWARAEE